MYAVTYPRDEEEEEEDLYLNKEEERNLSMSWRLKGSRGGGGRELLLVRCEEK